MENTGHINLTANDHEINIYNTTANNEKNNEDLSLRKYILAILDLFQVSCSDIQLLLTDQSNIYGPVPFLWNIMQVSIEQ